MSFSGCGGGDLAAVSGTVTLNGQPIGPGTIMFSPVTESMGTRMGVATFEEDGKYTLRSAGGKQGVPPGDYQVTITNRAPGSSFGDETTDEEASGSIPLKYSRKRSSGLTATVKANESNTFDFPLSP